MDKDEQTHSIIGTAMTVHGELGFGLLEAVFQETVTRELTLRRVPVYEQVRLPLLCRTSPHAVQDKQKSRSFP